MVGICFCWVIPFFVSGLHHTLHSFSTQLLLRHPFQHIVTCFIGIVLNMLIDELKTRLWFLFFSSIFVKIWNSHTQSPVTIQWIIVCFSCIIPTQSAIISVSYPTDKHMIKYIYYFPYKKKRLKAHHEIKRLKSAVIHSQRVKVLSGLQFLKDASGVISPEAENQ